MAADAVQAPVLPADGQSDLQENKIQSPPQKSLNYDTTTDDDSDGGEGPHEGYAMLKFGDSCYVMQALQLLIGRDMLAHRAGEFFNSQLEVIQSGNSLIYEAVLPVAANVNRSQTPAEPLTEAIDTIPVDDPDEMHQMMQNYCRERDSDAKSTDTCPFLNIHNPKSENDLFNTGSNISRRHCKIYYDADEGSFMIHVLSKNGLFLDGALETVGQCVELRHGSKIGIGQTEFTFELPNGGEETRIGYGFQNSQGDDIGAMYSSEEQEDSDLSELELFYDQDEIQYYSSGEEQSDAGSSNQVESDDENELEPENETADARQRPGARIPKASQKIRLNLSAMKERDQKADKSQKSLKKSKSGKQLPTTKSKSSKTIKRQVEVQDDDIDQEDVEDKVNEEQTPQKADKSSPDPDKSGVTRDSEIINGEGVFIEGLPMGAKIPPKKKGPGRPPKNGFLSKRELNQMSKAHKEAEKNGITDLNAAYLLMESKKAEKASKANREGGNGDGEDGDKDGNDSKKKTARAARSPSPEMKLSDYTEEQLQRPPDNYVVLIYEALVNHAQKKMNLQQIYSSIERRYPFFKFKTGTSGWQSSVRHNLGQNSTFQKVEKDGKGWMWGVVPGVTLESIREKKKKATPPPMPPPAHHSGSSGYQYGMPHSQPYPHNPNQTNPATHPNYINGVHGAPRPPIAQAGNSQHAPVTGQHPASQVLGGGSVASRPNTMYASPYNQGSQRPPNAVNHQVTSYGQSPSIRPAQPNQPSTLGANGPLNAPNRSMSTTPNLPQQQPQRPKPIPRPSPDVIDTFISVFTSSFRDMKYGQEITEQRANIIVRNAVARVLEPESVAHVPEDPSERAIITAFRKCLEQSQPRQDATGVPRTYNNYLYPYASRNQSSVFGTPGVSNIAARTSSPLSAAGVSANANVTAASNGSHLSGTQVARNVIPGSQAIPSSNGNNASTTSINGAVSTSVLPPRSSATPDLTKKPNTPIVGAPLASSTPPTIDLTSTTTSIAAPARVATPTTTTSSSSSSLANNVQQMLAKAATRESPRAPAIEPITPPAASSSKRSIDTVESVESQVSKKPLIA